MKNDVKKETHAIDCFHGLVHRYIVIDIYLYFNGLVLWKGLGFLYKEPETCCAPLRITLV